MNYPRKWTFESKEIAKNFDTHVRQSVPCYDEIQHMVGEMSNYFVRDGDKVLDLGVSTGTTLVNLYHYINKKKVWFIGIDESQAMIDVASKRLENLRGHEYNFLLHDLNRGLPKYLPDSGKFSLAISLFTMQFIKLENRLNLMRQTYENLRDGGAFIMLEKIQGNNAYFNEMMTDLYQDMKIRQGLKPEENWLKSQSLRGVQSPISVSDNMTKLQDAGFTNIDMFFKWYNFVGLIAVK